MQVDEIIERILSCDAEGLNDCIDNAGKPYQSEFMAATLKAAKDWLDSPLCTFCRHHVGDDSVTDTNGEIACRSCGEAEIAAQRCDQSVATPLPAPPRGK